MRVREPVAAFWWLWAALGWTVAGLYVTRPAGSFPLAPLACAVNVVVCLVSVAVNLVHRYRHRHAPAPRHAVGRTTP